MYRLITFICLVAIVSPAYAQDTMKDVVILNDGQIVWTHSNHHENLVALAAMPTPNPQETIDNKDPWVAFLLSAVITGGGQFYNGQKGKGVAMLLSAATGLGVMFYSLDDNYEFLGETIDPKDNDGIGLAGAVLALGAMTWSMIDAPMTAKAINRRNLQAISIEPVLTSKKIGGRLSLSF